MNIRIAFINWNLKWRSILNIIYNIICPIGVFSDTLDVNLTSIALWIYLVGKVIF